ncbi:MAG TPA: hypothetical protein VN851_05675 [Thermoanaerobaculia bacterium]|nr:hypothetical protein [Thermoanaerobaculia bacterium]
MIENAPGIERLRRAFATYDASPSEIEAEEIDAERIYRAAAGELPEDERRAVIDQVATSAAAAEVWRLAVELQRAEAKGAQEDEEAEFETDDLDEQPSGEVIPFRVAAPAPRRFFPRRTLTALAAVLAATIGFGLWTRMHAPAPGLRGAGTVLSATISDGASLPRGAFRLAWAPLPEAGARYTVRVTTEDLRPVAEGRHLETPSYQVPESALAALPAGARLLWQVEARTADGRTVASPAYEVEIAR